MTTMSVRVSGGGSFRGSLLDSASESVYPPPTEPEVCNTAARHRRVCEQLSLLHPLELSYRRVELDLDAVQRIAAGGTPAGHTGTCPAKQASTIDDDLLANTPASSRMSLSPSSSHPASAQESTRIVDETSIRRRVAPPPLLPSQLSVHPSGRDPTPPPLLPNASMSSMTSEMERQCTSQHSSSGTCSPVAGSTSLRPASLRSMQRSHSSSGACHQPQQPAAPLLSDTFTAPRRPGSPAATAHISGALAFAPLPLSPGGGRLSQSNKPWQEGAPGPLNSNTWQGEDGSVLVYADTSCCGHFPVRPDPLHGDLENSLALEATAVDAEQELHELYGADVSDYSPGGPGGRDTSEKGQALAMLRLLRYRANPSAAPLTTYSRHLAHSARASGACWPPKGNIVACNDVFLDEERCHSDSGPGTALRGLARTRSLTGRHSRGQSGEYCSDYSLAALMGGELHAGGPVMLQETRSEGASISGLHSPVSASRGAAPPYSPSALLGRPTSTVRSSAVNRYSSVLEPAAGLRTSRGQPSPRLASPSLLLDLPANTDLLSDHLFASSAKQSSASDYNGDHDEDDDDAASCCSMEPFVPDEGPHLPAILPTNQRHRQPPALLRLHPAPVEGLNSHDSPTSPMGIALSFGPPSPWSPSGRPQGRVARVALGSSDGRPVGALDSPRSSTAVRDVFDPPSRRSLPGNALLSPPLAAPASRRLP